MRKFKVFECILVLCFLLSFICCKSFAMDSGFEVIYDADGNRVDDSRDVGTYNYVSPNSDPFGHFIKDVMPWFKYGNSQDDTTTKEQRVLSFFGIYIR